MLPISSPLAHTTFLLGGSGPCNDGPTSMELHSRQRGPWLRVAETSDTSDTELKAMSGRDLRIVGANRNDPSIIVRHDGELQFLSTPSFEKLTVRAFTNLVSSFAIKNPYMPPSAAALNSAFVTLSNLIVQRTPSATTPSEAELQCSTTLVGGDVYSDPPEDIDVDFGVVSCTTLRVNDGGHIDARSFKNLVQDWTAVTARDVPVSAYAVYDAFTTLSNARHLLENDKAIEWRNLTNGELLASIDANGVFYARGGICNMGLTSTLAEASSNLAASMASLHAVREQVSAMASIAFSKAEESIRTVEELRSDDDWVLSTLSNLTEVFSIVADENGLAVTANRIVLPSYLRLEAPGGYAGIASNVRASRDLTSNDAFIPVSITGIAPLVDKVHFASNLSVPIDMLSKTAPMRASQTNFASNAGAWASNAAVVASLTIAPAALVASNVAFWASNAASTAVRSIPDFQSTFEKAAWSSNAADLASNAASFASNLSAETGSITSTILRSMPAWIENNSNAMIASQTALEASVLASNLAVNSLRLATTATESAGLASNAAKWASNHASIAFKDAQWASNSSFWASNALFSLSNAIVPASAFVSTSNASRYASNVSTWLCNWTLPNINSTRDIANSAFVCANWASNTCHSLLYLQSLSTTFSGAATYGSNYASYAYRLAQTASNLIGVSVPEITSNSKSAGLALARATFASNLAASLGTGQTEAIVTARLASNAAYSILMQSQHALDIAQETSESVVMAMGLGTYASNVITSQGIVLNLADSCARYASNEARMVSMTTSWIGAMADFASNASTFSSNNVVLSTRVASAASNVAIHASNAIGALSKETSLRQLENTQLAHWTSNMTQMNRDSLKKVEVDIMEVSGVTRDLLSNATWSSNEIALGLKPQLASTTLRSSWASNVAYWGSNILWEAHVTSKSLSNAFSSLSSAALWSSNMHAGTLARDEMARFSSNIAGVASNSAYKAISWASWASNTSLHAYYTSSWSSNAAAWASNLSGKAPFWSSNTSSFSSNVGVWASNTSAIALDHATWGSNLAQGVPWSSNAAYYSSNASSWASNASRDGTWASNLAEPRATWASNLCADLSAQLSTGSNPNLEFASNTACIASNVAFNVQGQVPRLSEDSMFASNLAMTAWDHATFASNAGAFGSNTAAASRYIRSYASHSNVINIIEGSMNAEGGGVGVSLCNAPYHLSMATGWDALGSTLKSGGGTLCIESDTFPIQLKVGGRGGLSRSNAAMEFPPPPGPSSNALYGAFPGFPYQVSASSGSASAWNAFSHSNLRGDTEVVWTSDLGYTTQSGFANSPPNMAPETTVDGTIYRGQWLQLQLPATMDAWIYAPESYRLVPKMSYTGSGVPDGQPVRFLLAGSADGGSSWTTLDATYAFRDYAPANAVIEIACPKTTSAFKNGLVLNAIRIIILKVSVANLSSQTALFLPVNVAAFVIRSPPVSGTVSMNSGQVLITSCMGLGTQTPLQRLHVEGSAIVTKRMGLGGVTQPRYLLELAEDSAAKPASSLWSVLCDRRLKKDVCDADLQRCTEIVRGVPLRRFAWRDDIYNTHETPDRSRLGWIAQEVAKAFPKAISRHTAHGLDDCMGLNADQLLAALYGSVQLLLKRVDQLEMMDQ